MVYIIYSVFTKERLKNRLVSVETKVINFYKVSFESVSTFTKWCVNLYKVALKKNSQSPKSNPSGLSVLEIHPASPCWKKPAVGSVEVPMLADGGQRFAIY